MGLSRGHWGVGWEQGLKKGGAWLDLRAGKFPLAHRKMETGGGEEAGTRPGPELLVARTRAVTAA